MKPEHLKKMRELSGLTQGQLGERLGFAVTDKGDCSAISWHETGRAKTSFELAQRWATYCGFYIQNENEIVVDIDLYFQLVEKAEKYDKIIKTISK